MSENVDDLEPEEPPHRPLPELKYQFKIYRTHDDVLHGMSEVFAMWKRGIITHRQMRSGVLALSSIDQVIQANEASRIREIEANQARIEAERGAAPELEATKKGETWDASPKPGKPN